MLKKSVCLRALRANLFAHVLRVVRSAGHESGGWEGTVSGQNGMLLLLLSLIAYTNFNTTRCIVLRHHAENTSAVLEVRLREMRVSDVD